MENCKKAKKYICSLPGLVILLFCSVNYFLKNHLKGGYRHYEIFIFYIYLLTVKMLYCIINFKIIPTQLLFRSHPVFLIVLDELVFKWFCIYFIYFFNFGVSRFFINFFSFILHFNRSFPYCLSSHSLLSLFIYPPIHSSVQKGAGLLKESTKQVISR